MIQIRKAILPDLKEIVELFDKYRIFYEKVSDKKNAEIFLLERLKLDDSKIYVAETRNINLVGFIQLYPLFSSTRMKKLWLLNDLFIEKEYRGKGISKQLIQVAKELCIQTKSCGLILETSKSNKIGNKLYPKTGFILDEENNYYSWNI